ncbi:MAG TPA: hypothetical protein VGQ46_04640 [Thermoanaerobaculia bacterium]|nr:hypothetical protein [Thermoanaerobaculia bacterium]
MSDDVADPTRPSSFTVPAGSSVLSQDVLDPRWTSFGRPAILHLDVPPALIVESRNAFSCGRIASRNLPNHQAHSATLRCRSTPA